MTSLQARHRRDKTMIGLMIAALVVAFVPLAPGGGFGAGIRGTIKMVGLGTAIAVPIGVFAAVYLAEYSGRRNTLATAVRFFADVMTGIPSIFVGIFVFTVVVLTTGSFSTYAGGIALGILMIP